jgi:hypothetical protein
MAEIINIPDKAIIYDIDIDLWEPIKRNTIYSKQWDTRTRYIRATIYNNGVLYPLTTSDVIHYCATKSDGYSIDNFAGIDSEGKIIYWITDQTTAKDGQFDAEFRIFSGTSENPERKGTPKFVMWVEKSAVNDNAIISSDEFNALTQTLSSIEHLSEEVTEAVNNVHTAIGNLDAALEGVETLNQQLIEDEDEREKNEQFRIQRDALRPDYIYITKEAYEALQLSEREDPNKIYEITNDNGAVFTELQDLIDNTESAISDTLEAKVEAENAATNANDLSHQFQNNESIRQGFYDAYKECSPYNNTKSYIVNNKVTYQGGTYQCILNSTGITPAYNANNPNWICIAAKGNDGAGGDMFKSFYDTHNKQIDIYDYADSKVENVALFGNSGGLVGTAIPTDAERLQGYPASYFEGLVDTVDDKTGTISDRVNVIESVYPQLANPNILINPNFKINQRGKSSYNTANAYTVDRWINHGVNTTITPTSLGINISCTYTDDSNLLRQIVEHPELYAGMTLTLSIKYKNLVLGTNEKFILGFNDDINNYQEEISTTSGIAKVTGIVSSNPNLLAVRCTKIGTGSSFSVDIEWLKLEVSSIATPFIPRLYGEELALCQRYYERSKDINSLIGSKICIGVHPTLLSGFDFAVEKRVTPTITLYSRNGTPNKVSLVDTGADIGTEVTASPPSTKTIRTILDSGSEFTKGLGYEVNYVADAEIY